MNDQVITFITQFIPLNEEEIRIIAEQNLIRFYKKDTILLTEGQLAKECFVVLEGCVRKYYLIDGEERNTEFYLENETITPVSYLKKQPSEYHLSCLEDCILAIGSEERNKKLLEKVPRLTTMILEMNNELLVQTQNTFDDFKNLSPEMRYLKLMETRPEILDRVPLYHIATYLGITPVSLSRMRKRIAGK